MFLYVPFEDLTQDHLVQIARCQLRAPEDERPESKFIVEQLASGGFRLFTFEGGLVICSKRGKRLVLEIMTASIWKRKDLADTFRKLATDWECDTVETLVFDSRLADAIVAVGGQVEHYCMTLPVGNEDGR